MSTRITSFESVRDIEDLRDLDTPQSGYGTACDPVTQAGCTLIQTANSFYLFRVTAPYIRSGLLVGGVIGECPVSALLVGTLPDGDHAGTRDSTLRIGARAVFVVERNGIWKGIITSRIMRLAHSPIRHREQMATSH